MASQARLGFRFRRFVDCRQGLTQNAFCHALGMLGLRLRTVIWPPTTITFQWVGSISRPRYYWRAGRPLIRQHIQIRCLDCCNRRWRGRRSVSRSRAGATSGAGCPSVVFIGHSAASHRPRWEPYARQQRRTVAGTAFGHAGEHIEPMSAVDGDDNRNPIANMSAGERSCRCP